MKSAFVYIVFLLGLIGISAQVEKKRVTDFRDIHFGSHLDSTMLNGRKVNFQAAVNRDAEARSYYIPGDNMYIGNVKLDVIHYIFNEENRFTKVYCEGSKDQAKEMAFIISFKFGEANESRSLGGLNYKIWNIQDVNFTLVEQENLKFFLSIESDWALAEAYKKNTAVSDF